MKNQVSQKLILYSYGGPIAWDYAHEGIPKHYILQRNEMLDIPNWWGATHFHLFLLPRNAIRLYKPKNKESFKLIGLRLLAGALFAIGISVSFMNGIDVTDYIMGLISILALVFPLWKSKYLLDWIFGGVFSFGANIPTLFGSILCLIFVLIYQ
mgnify:CR=1 FL=1